MLTLGIATGCSARAPGGTPKREYPFEEEEEI
jgi:hypothetical protein